MDVEVGHCFVEPVAFDGEEWNVPFNKQFGWGGGRPEIWEGTGLMTRIGGGMARYDDDGGAVVDFFLVDDPSVRPVETAGCD